MPLSAGHRLQQSLCCKARQLHYLPTVFSTFLVVFFLVVKSATAKEYSSQNLDNIANAFASAYVFYSMQQDFTEEYPALHTIKLLEDESGNLKLESFPDQNDPLFNAEQSFENPSPYYSFEWPRIEMNLGKGRLSELIDSKQFCGAMIYSSRYFASLFVSEKTAGLRTVMAFMFLTPAAYQHNEDFNYEKADLPTILTIYAIKTSTKLLDIDMKASGLSHYSSALLYAPVVIGLWFRHSGMAPGSKPYFWLAVPKIYMSSMLGHVYKGTAAQMPLCESKACGYFTSGIIFISTGLFLSGLNDLGHLPALDGLSSSFTGKIGKLAGYGIADALTEVASSDIADPFVYYGTNIAVLLCLTQLTESIHKTGMFPYVTGSMRRGLIVRTALSSIELKILKWATALKFIYIQTSDQLQYSDYLRDSQHYYDYLSASVQSPEHTDQCSIIPVAGTATEQYRIVCPIEGLNKQENESLVGLLTMVIVCILTSQY
ncbi:hypothetical protein GZ77_03380 [Endozoicomonas montiporae]|uniref:Uncharacterized protein n=2 Tax=Endozoicomonas montiporae TaxID=1027273 RepID=A0A081NB16_9GAMM|nr:hypothetical protein [Endozoicomonas montiporae]AMO56654.1 hypothetical protein EZMO1_2578 [Endozoicomonas montiporae CL-33]KEQ15639.1 hypothetical protein GZ77_03380 [Endozoicomonas montiporae]